MLSRLVFFFSSCVAIIMTSMPGILKTSLMIPKTRLVFREKIYSLSSFANIFIQQLSCKMSKDSWNLSFLLLAFSSAVFSFDVCHSVMIQVLIHAFK